MSKNKVLDVDNLNEIFEIPKIDSVDEIIELEPLSGEILDDIPPNNAHNNDQSISNKENFVEIQLKDLLKTSNEMMDAAKYLINSCPDAETIDSASSMIDSIAKIIAEFNRTIMLGKRFQLQTELEKVKIDARANLIRLRASIQNDPKLIMGDGNTINIQQNNLVPFNQESIVRQLIAEENNS